MFLVGGCGTIDWRKGPDLFIQVALDLVVRQQRHDVAFVWVGGDPNSEAMAQVRHDLNHMGLERWVNFIGSLDDPVAAGWYASLNAFALTSREDPFPLVMQEAAGAGLPVVAFRGSGGADEFVVPGETGELVDFADCHAMSRVLADWTADRSRAAMLGEAARERLRKHFDPEVLGGALFAVDSRVAREAHAGSAHRISRRSFRRLCRP